MAWTPEQRSRFERHVAAMVRLAAEDDTTALGELRHLRRLLDAGIRAAAREQHARGYSTTEIADGAGVGQSTAARWTG